MFSLICVWINGWVNNREAGDLRRYRAHYDVIVMNLNDKFLFVDTIWANLQPHENEFRELANGGDQIGSLLNQAHSLQR